MIEDHESEGVHREASNSSPPSSRTAAHPSLILKVLIALLLLSQATTGDAVRDDQVVVHGSGVSVGYGLVTWMCIWLLVWMPGLLGSTEMDGLAGRRQGYS